MIPMPEIISEQISSAADADGRDYEKDLVDLSFFST